MWILILAMSLSSCGAYVTLSKQYDTERQCTVVGESAVITGRAVGFRCIDSDWLSAGAPQ